MSVFEVVKCNPNVGYDGLIEKIKSAKKIETKGNAIILNYLIDVYKELSNLSVLPKVIYELCVILCEHLQNINQKEKVKYLRVMYYVLKYFVDKESYAEVLTLARFVSPSWFSTSTLLPEHKDTYNNIFALFYNKCNVIFRQKIQTQEYNFYSQLITTTIVFCSAASLQNTIPLEVAVKFYEKIEYSNYVFQCLTSEQILETFERILESIMMCPLVTQDEMTFLKLILNMQSLFIRQQPQCEQLKRFTNNISTMVENTKFRVFIPSIRLICEVHILLNIIPTLDQVKLKDILNNLYTIAEQFELRIVQFIVYKLTAILSTTAFQNIKEKFYSDGFEDFFNDWCNILGQLRNLLTDSNIDKCTACSNCNASQSLILAIEPTILILKLSKILQVQNEKLLNLVEASFINALSVGQKVQETGCSQWQRICVKMCTLYYNEIVRLHVNVNLSEYILRVLAILSNTILDHLGLNCDDSSDLVNRILQLISVTYATRNEFVKALQPLALSAALFGNKYESSSSWPVIKSKARSGGFEEITEITMVDVLQTSGNELKSIFNKFDVSCYDLTQVALHEVTVLSKKWPARLCLGAACRSVMVATQDVFIRVKAFQALWKSSSPPRDKYLQQELDATIELLKKFEDGDLLIDTALSLSYLYTLKYEYKMAELQAGCVGKTIVLKAVGQEGDEGLCYDLSYDIRKEMENIAYLDNVCNNLIIALECKYEDKNKKIQDYDVMTYLSILPIKYKLHFCQLESAKATILCYKFAEILGDNNLQVQCLCDLLENVPTKTEFGQILLKKCEKLIGNVTDLKNQELQLRLLISQAAGLFLSYDYQVGCDKLEEANLYWEKNQLKDKLLLCRIYQLRTQYLSLPCNLVRSSDHGDALIIGRQTLQTLVDLIKDLNAVVPYDYIRYYLFEFSLYYGNIYSERCLTREARSYMRDQLQFAVQCVLPLQVVKFLCEMIRVDILDSRFADCEIKYKHVLTLLCFIHKSNNDLGAHVGDEIFEQVDSNCTLKNNSQMFEFLKHAEDCVCYFCNNLTYQQLCFEAMCIQVELNSQLSCKFGTEDFDEKYVYASLLKRTNKRFLLQPSLTIGYVNDFTAYLDVWETDLAIIISKFLIYRASKFILEGQYKEANSIVARLLKMKHVSQFSHAQIFYKICELHFNVAACMSDVNSESMLRPSPKPPRSTKNNLRNTRESSVRIFPVLSTPAKTPALQHNKFFKSRTPGAMRTPIEFKIYTPISKKKIRKKIDEKIPLKNEQKSPNSHDLDRLYTPYKLSSRSPSSPHKSGFDISKSSVRYTAVRARRKIETKEDEINKKNYEIFASDGSSNVASDIQNPRTSPKTTNQPIRSSQRKIPSIKINMPETSEQTIDKVVELTECFEKKISLGSEVLTTNLKTRSKQTQLKSKMSKSSNIADDLQSVSSNVSGSSDDDESLKKRRPMRLRTGKKCVALVDSSSSQDSSPIPMCEEIPQRILRKTRKTKDPTPCNLTKDNEKCRSVKKKAADVSVPRTVKQTSVTANDKTSKPRIRKTKNPFIL